MELIVIFLRGGSILVSTFVVDFILDAGVRRFFSLVILGTGQIGW